MREVRDKEEKKVFVQLGKVGAQGPSGENESAQGSGLRGREGKGVLGFRIYSIQHPAMRRS